jgi:hypothetical protein
LSLSDFAPDEISSGDESSVLSISFKRLAYLLAQAEERGQTRESDDGRQGIKSTRRTKKRRPSSSPAEELRSEDEAEYCRREEKATERAAAEDEDFQEPVLKRRA